VVDQQRDSIVAQIDNSFQSLVINNPKVRLPENVFVNYFLPFFSGTATAESINARNVISEWIGVAGTAMAEVDIIDVSGQVIFTVPALFDTDMINIAAKQAGQSMSDIVNEYSLRKAGVPQAATNYLNTALFNLGNGITRESNHADAIALRWAGIFQRYGIAGSNNTNSSKLATQDNPGDDLDYS